MSDLTQIRYSVVQYMPDPIRQEVFNVGVVVAQGEQVVAKVVPTSQANRLKALGYDRDLAFLKDLEGELNRGTRHEQVELPEGQTAWTVADLERAAKEWGGTIRFSPMRPGRIQADRDPLEVMYAKIVPTRIPIARGPNRSSVKRRVREGLVRVLSRRYANEADPKGLIHSSQRVRGKLEEHVFDYGIANGKPLHLVKTVSFDVDNRDALADELDATKWAIVDLQNAKSRTPPLSVVAAGTRQGALREQTEDVLTKLNTRLFGESEIHDWETFVEDSLPRSLGAGSRTTRRR
jgi:hypothetical protein